jgi:hypothetical protein
LIFCSNFKKAKQKQKEKKKKKMKREYLGRGPLSRRVRRFRPTPLGTSCIVLKAA